MLVVFFECLDWTDERVLFFPSLLLSFSLLGYDQLGDEDLDEQEENVFKGKKRRKANKARAQQEGNETFLSVGTQKKVRGKMLRTK